MKDKIHPKYQVVKCTCVTCGNEFDLGSTAKEIRVDTCSNCHPFYTGQDTFTAVAGRVDKFNKRYGIENKK